MARRERVYKSEGAPDNLYKYISMSYDSTDNAELSEAAAAFLCSLNIGENNESNTTHDDKDIHPAAIAPIVVRKAMGII